MDPEAAKLPAKRTARKARMELPAPTSEVLTTSVAVTEAAAMQGLATVEPVVEALPKPVDAVAPEPDAPASPAPATNEPTPAETIAPTIAEGLNDMATAAPVSPTETVGIASDKLQNLFGDVGARMKASFEKSTKLGEEMVELAKGNVEAVVASARVAAKGGEALGQDAADYTKKSMEHAVAAMKSFASVKSPTELFQLQSDFAKASFDSAVAEASKFSESMMKLASEVTQPLSTRYAVAAEKIKSATL